MNSRSPLAIIVPAFKPDFLHKALTSIEAQTGDYQVYIFDDASPSNLFLIVEPFLANPDWHYYRFEKNMGGTSLAGHWNRCIEATTEPWIWLFSDDDEMQADCVRCFLDTIQHSETESDVYRFDQKIIDEKGFLQHPNFQVPERLTGFQFGRLRFFRALNSTAVEYICARSAFNRAGGFPDFPLGWCADDAAWIDFAGEKPIITLQCGGVNWRTSTVNLSGSQAFTIEKLSACIQFINWFNQKFKVEVHSQIFAEEIIWLRLQMVELAFEPGFAETLQILKKLAIPLSMNWLRTFGDLYCLTYIYRQKVILAKQATGIRVWLHFFLPKF